MSDGGVRRRGDGVGIEIGATALRGVRLAHDAAGRVVAAAEETVARPDDDAIVDALVRLAARLAVPPGVAVRLAWFPPDGYLHAVDVTGRPDLVAVTRELGEAGLTAATLVEAGARRWLVAVRWDPARAAQLAAMGERAGLVVDACEPAPLAVARLLPAAPAVVARGDVGDGWRMVSTDGVALMAVRDGSGDRRDASLAAVELSADQLARLGRVGPGDADRMAALLDEVAGAALARRSVPPPTLLLTGDAYPTFAPDHEWSAARQGVALGAAVAAAGLTGRVRAVEPLVATGPTGGGPHRPWVVERLPDDPPVAERRAPWWRRLLHRLGRR